MLSLHLATSQRCSSLLVLETVSVYHLHTLLFVAKTTLLCKQSSQVKESLKDFWCPLQNGTNPIHVIYKVSLLLGVWYDLAFLASV